MQASRPPNGLRLLENLAYLVPGYHGYRQCELRREEDSRMRARVCRSIDGLMGGMGGLRSQWNGQAPASLLEALEEGQRQLARSAEMVRYAPGQLTRFFEAERVSELTLERVLEADLLIFQDLEEAQTQVGLGVRLSAAPRTIRRFLRELDEILHRLDEHLLMRERILAGG